MARQRKVSDRDGIVTSFGKRGTEKGGGKGGKKRNDKNNSKEKSGKSPPKKGSDAKNKSRNLRNSLTSSPLNSGLDSTGKPNIGKSCDKNSKGKPETNESETNDVDYSNEQIDQANSDFQTNKNLNQQILKILQKNDESILEDSIEESKKNEEEIRVVGVVDKLVVIYNSIEEVSKLNKQQS